MKSDHIKRMITLTGDNNKRLSLYYSAVLCTVNGFRRLDKRLCPVFDLFHDSSFSTGKNGQKIKL